MAVRRMIVSREGGLYAQRKDRRTCRTPRRGLVARERKRRPRRHLLPGGQVPLLARLVHYMSSGELLHRRHGEPHGLPRREVSGRAREGQLRQVPRREVRVRHRAYVVPFLLPRALPGRHRADVLQDVPRGQDRAGKWKHKLPQVPSREISTRLRSHNLPCVLSREVPGRSGGDVLQVVPRGTGHELVREYELPQVRCRKIRAELRNDVLP
jgi:hypothetical protein